MRIKIGKMAPDVSAAKSLLPESQNPRLPNLVDLHNKGDPPWQASRTTQASQRIFYRSPPNNQLTEVFLANTHKYLVADLPVLSLEVML